MFMFAEGVSFMVSFLRKPLVAASSLVGVIGLGAAACLRPAPMLQYFSSPPRPPPAEILKFLMPAVKAGSTLTGVQLWRSSPLVALVLRRPG
jgi:hypothetical protein